MPLKQVQCKWTPQSHALKAVEHEEYDKGMADLLHDRAGIGRPIPSLTRWAVLVSNMKLYTIFLLEMTCL